MIHVASVSSKSTLSGVQQQDIQPNACDLRLSKVFQINYSKFTLSEDEKEHRGSVELQPDSLGWWHLNPGSYEIVMENIIEVGPGEAGWVIPRSTLNRNGVFITSGLYDSGYHGVMAGAMHVNAGPFSVQKGTRVGQFVLFAAESLHKYNGSYGLNTVHDKKYGV